MCKLVSAIDVGFFEADGGVHSHAEPSARLPILLPGTYAQASPAMDVGTAAEEILVCVFPTSTSFEVNDAGFETPFD